MKSRSLLIAGLLLLGGCPERRKPVPLKSKDLGPSVVVIDKRPATPPPVGGVAVPTLPLDDEKEPDDTRAQAQPMTPGRGIKGRIELPPSDKKLKADEDWYSLVVPAAGEGDVLLEVVIRAVDGKRAAPSFALCADDCKTLFSVAGGKVGEPLAMPNYATRAGQTIYVRVDRLPAPKPGRETAKDPGPPPPTEPLAYELYVVASAAPAHSEREPNDSKDTASPIEENVDWEGRYSRLRDEDYYAWKGGASDAIGRVELSAVPGVTPQITWGTLVIKGQRGEELRLRNLPLPANSDGRLIVRNADGRNEAQAYVLRLSSEAPLEGAEREPNDKLEEAHKLPLPDAGGSLVVSGFLWSGDADTYRIEGPDDARYQLELAVPARADLRLERLSATGQVVNKVDQGGAGKTEQLGPELVSTTPLVRVRGRAKDVLFDEPYTLTLRRAE